MCYLCCRDEELHGTNEAADAMLSESFADYESGGYSPQYLSQSQLDPGTFVMNEEDDMQRLEFARMQVQGTGSRVEVRFHFVFQHNKMLLEKDQLH